MELEIMAKNNVEISETIRKYSEKKAPKAAGASSRALSRRMP